MVEFFLVHRQRVFLCKKNLGVAVENKDKCIQNLRSVNYVPIEMLLRAALLYMSLNTGNVQYILQYTAKFIYRTVCSF
jgi:hypothetical protein